MRLSRIVRISFYARQFLEQLDAGLRDELRAEVAKMTEAPAEHLRRARTGEPPDILFLEYHSELDPTLRFRLAFMDSALESGVLVLLTIGHTSLPPEFETGVD